MLDVTFIMLIFFIVTASFVKAIRARCEPAGPGSATGRQEKGAILVVIDNSDNIWVDNRIYRSARRAREHRANARRGRQAARSSCRPSPQLEYRDARERHGRLARGRRRQHLDRGRRLTAARQPSPQGAISDALARNRYGRRPRRLLEEEESEINLTPMLDVTFIMLIFFIVTAVFVKRAGRRCEPADGHDRGRPGARQHLRRRSRRTTRSGSMATRRPGLRAQRDRAAQGREPRGRRRYPGRQVGPQPELLAVMDAAKQAGVTDITIAADKTARAAERRPGGARVDMPRAAEVH